jgi:hypothetical protein
MGNWHPSQKKNEVDLSPQVLSQTSLDDKVWLEVTEENLFNESFTNEKYYLLHSRNAEPDPLGSHPSRQREKLLNYSGKKNSTDLKNRVIITAYLKTWILDFMFLFIEQKNDRDYTKNS